MNVSHLVSHTISHNLDASICELLLSLSGYHRLSQIIPDARNLSERNATNNEPQLDPANQALLKRLQWYITKREEITDLVEKYQHTENRVVQAVLVNLEEFLRQLAAHVALYEQRQHNGRRDSALDREQSLISLWTHFQPYEDQVAYLSELVKDFQHEFLSFGNEKHVTANLMNRLYLDYIGSYSVRRNLIFKLLRSAERQFVAQLGSWVIHGEVEEFSCNDFFIQCQSSSGSYVVMPRCCPDLVDTNLQELVLKIGQIVRRLHQRNGVTAKEEQLLHKHEILLAAATDTSPIDSDLLEAAIQEIGRSISQDLLSEILPRTLVDKTVRMLRNIFLTEDSLFAETLIELVQISLHNIGSSHIGKLKNSTIDNLLKRTFAKILQDDSHLLDSPTDYSSFSLAILYSEENAQPSFDGLLFGFPIHLKYRITWPIDLFLHTRDIDFYSRCFTYLIALRRTRQLLRNLWRGRRDQITRPTISRATWVAAYRTSSFLQILSDHYYTDILAPGMNGLCASLQSIKGTYNPIEFAIQHTMTLETLSRQILLDEFEFMRIMYELLTAIDLMFTSLRTNKEIHMRCGAMVDLVSAAILFLTKVPGTEALLAKLQPEYLVNL